MAAHTGLMLTGFLNGAVACSRYINAALDEDEPALNEKAAHAALRQCLEGTFILFPILLDVSVTTTTTTSSASASTSTTLTSTPSVSAVEHAVLASVFPHTPRSLAPLFERARSLTTALSKAAARPKSGLHRGQTLSPSPGPAMSPLSAARLHAALITFGGCVAVLDRLPLPSTTPPGKNKKERAANEATARSRPARVALEAQLLNCDLALGMATVTIDAVKRRALDGDDADADPADDTAWDETAEADLEGCLVTAVNLVRNRHVGVLIDATVRYEWLEEEEEEVKDESMGSNGTETSNDANNNDDQDDDQLDDSDDDDIMSVDSAYDSDGAPTSSYPSPLRTLFRLYDRYEEQRIAVWMSLSEGRPKMTQFVRGTDGHVGDRWDELGALLLRNLTPEQLLEHGLVPDRLDRWVDRADEERMARGGEGKAKKAKKGRQTMSTGQWICRPVQVS